MPAPTTVDDFLEVVRKSNQVDTARLDAYLEQPREAPLPSIPRKLAIQLIRDGLMTMFQAEQFLLGKYKGFALGGYKVIERLGAGGAGTVYMGEHPDMKRRVALKVLPTPFAEDPGLLARFQREARAASVLDHPNVVQVYDLRQDGGLHFIVMEYIDGPNLQQVLTRRGALPVPVACEYIRQAALGLQHAHEQGLVHRDIKPANLLVDRAGVVKVLDLGLALFEEEGKESLTQKFNSKMVLGTADYLSPEQALNLHEVDARADIYSLGATLYALLAGRPPFHEGSIGQKLVWHQSKEATPLHTINPEIPEELSLVVQQMLAKRPEDRIQSAGDVAEALSQWADQVSRPEVPPSSRTLTELRLEARTGPLGSRTSTSGRLLPTPAADTWVSRAKEDTDTTEGDARKTGVMPMQSRAALEDEEPEKKSSMAAVIVAAAAVIVGAIGGVAGYLLLR